MTPVTDAGAAAIVAALVRGTMLGTPVAEDAVQALESLSTYQVSRARRALTEAYHAVLDETRARRRNGG